MDTMTSVSPTLREEEKKYISGYKFYGKLLEDLRRIPEMSLENRAISFKKIEAALNNSPLESYVERKKNQKNEPELEIDPITMTEEKENQEKAADVKEDNSFLEKKYAGSQYTFSTDNRKSSEIIRDKSCHIVFRGFDEKINQVRYETAQKTCFEYTHVNMARIFKNKSFLKGDISMIKTEKGYFLNLKVIIASRDAKKSYGMIEKGAMIRFSLINGKTLFSQNLLDSEGSLEAYSGNTIYNAFYEIDKDDIENLKEVELDSIGILWSTGFEDYPVYNVDFIINQINCLNNADEN